MSKYENAIKLMEEFCGNGKDNVIALATISLSLSAAGNPRPTARMVNAYYEDSTFYASTSAKKNKTQQIEKNNEVSICGFGYAFQGTAENLGWVNDERNAEIRMKMEKYFKWYDKEGNEDGPRIVLRIILTEGTIYDREKKYGDGQYKIDFVNKTAE